jgi:hypothetical protein
MPNDKPNNAVATTDESTVDVKKLTIRLAAAAAATAGVIGATAYVVNKLNKAHSEE